MDGDCQTEYTEVKLTISLIQGGYYCRNIPWADSETDQKLPKCKFQVKLKKGNQFLQYDLDHIPRKSIKNCFEDLNIFYIKLVKLWKKSQMNECAKKTAKDQNTEESKLDIRIGVDIIRK